MAARPVFAAGQVDQQRAAAYFQEAAAMCEREGGRLWGLSLCGPMVFADAETRTIATNQPPPDAPRPPVLGFANAAVAWGGVRWSTYVWSMLPADDRLARGRILLHELFHRVQPELGLITREGNNDHLDGLDGRYWLKLEWRALAKALGSLGTDRAAAASDALAFRATRRRVFPSAGENERLEEIREGLAQYTGTVAAAADRQAAETDAVAQLSAATRNPTFVRTFAYPLGAAYGLLLDGVAPGWTRRVKAGDDLGELLRQAGELRPPSDAAALAERYGGAALRADEERRDATQKERVADLRRRFVDGPVLVLPGAPGSFTSLGVTAVPGAGTVYPDVRITAEWGTLVAALALRSTDRSTISLPAPGAVEGPTLKGEGWTLTLAAGWHARTGARPGDSQLVRDAPGSGR